MDSDLQYKNFQLRPLNEADLERILNWRNSDRIREASFNDKVISLAEHRAWFDRLRTASDNQAFVFEKAHRSVGFVNISDLDLQNRRCRWGFYIGDAEAEKGLGTAMAFLALNYLFEKLKLEKVVGEVIASNESSYRYHLKLGFKEEGRLRRHLFRHQQWDDVLILSLFRESWLQKRSEIEDSINSRSNS